MARAGWPPASAPGVITRSSSLPPLRPPADSSSITLPAYVKDVARVQIYRSWAEAVLGEAPFDLRIQTLTAR